MENEGVLCSKLKLKGNLFTEGLLSKEDLIELIRQSEECQVEPTHSTLLEMARRKKDPKSYNPNEIRVEKSARFSIGRYR